MQEVPFLSVGQFFSLAFDLLAPGQDFLVFGMYFVPVNGVHQQVRALITSSDPLFFSERVKLVVLMARDALPTIFAESEQARAHEPRDPTQPL